MAVQKPSIPKGTRDFSPEQVAKRKYILSTIEKVFIKYGFMPIETPTMENLSTLEGKYGDEGDKLLFRILNSGDAFKEIKEKNGDQQISNFEFRISNFRWFIHRNVPFICHFPNQFGFTSPASWITMSIF